MWVNQSPRPGQLKMWGYVNLGFFPFFCRPEMLDFSASPVSSQVPALHLVDFYEEGV